MTIKSSVEYSALYEAEQRLAELQLSSASAEEIEEARKEVVERKLETREFVLKMVQVRLG